MGTSHRIRGCGLSSHLRRVEGQASRAAHIAGPLPGHHSFCRGSCPARGIVSSNRMHAWRRRWWSGRNAQSLESWPSGWDFERTMRGPGQGRRASATSLPSFEWPGYGRRQPEQVTLEELRKLEIYCFANCASEMVPVKVRGQNGVPTPWIESYGNEMDIVARLGVLANVKGPGSVSIAGDRYRARRRMGTSAQCALSFSDDGSPAKQEIRQAGWCR